MWGENSMSFCPTMAEILLQCHWKVETNIESDIGLTLKDCSQTEVGAWQESGREAEAWTSTHKDTFILVLL